MHFSKMAAAALIGLALSLAVVERHLALAMAGKLMGRDQPCRWSTLALHPWHQWKFSRIQASATSHVAVERRDPALDIELVRTGGRAFWIKSHGEIDGASTLAYALAEQKWIAGYAGKNNVQRGDVVVDVGAHVGTFDDDALSRGASKVIMVEPDPVNVECLRRNFAREIADGRAVVVPEGAWDSRSTLEFSTGVRNSATGSFVLREKGTKNISVPVRPLDEILAELGVSKVDYLKMDIEGAERTALRGARQTLRRWKPVIMLDQYHRTDDAVVLPRVVQEANQEYRASYDLAWPLGETGRYVPYVVFYR
jgi:FkbM family methyltransferase